MPDLVTDSVRSALMRRVRQHGTPGEKRVAAACREVGLTYRLNVRSLPGSPDLASKKYRWAIFVHGCFWHQHEGCVKATMPKRNAVFWQEKLAANRRRDAGKAEALRQLGYTVLTIWECETLDAPRIRRHLRRMVARVASSTTVRRPCQIPRPQ
jgi:DNA mismatch endonuclease, patch repair protein